MIPQLDEVMLGFSDNPCIHTKDDLTEILDEDFWGHIEDILMYHRDNNKIIRLPEAIRRGV